jgi:hypothetical protein
VIHKVVLLQVRTPEGLDEFGAEAGVAARLARVMDSIAPVLIVETDAVDELRPTGSEAELGEIVTGLGIDGKQLAKPSAPEFAEELESEEEVGLVGVAVEKDGYPGWSNPGFQKSLTHRLITL